MMDGRHSFYKPVTIYPFSLDPLVAWYVLLQNKIGLFLVLEKQDSPWQTCFDEICLFLYRLTELNL